MELIKGALEMLKGYCEKHSACKNGCVFYDSEKGCIFQNNIVPADWKIPEKEGLFE
jgi:hypothetical protein